MSASSLHDTQHARTSATPPRLAVFIDVQNIYYTVRDTFGRQFDYRRLWAELERLGTIQHAYAYAIDRGDPKQQQFQQRLRDIGFEVKLKPFIQRSDGSAKGDWDVGITIDVMEAAPEVDEIILASGDGDFAMLLEHVSTRHAVTTRVYGVEALTAHALMRSATDFREIGTDLLMR
ncbi:MULTISPECIES: LabA-like NYN domain-containing protein [Cobetia]|uniref:LabA-like NYN domain-containing protein n=1 Tax=Cobetia TaxID=204286 RepID=UPI00046AE485|nr:MULTISPECIES: NYN domain-containing protein [Cobetia]